MLDLLNVLVEREFKLRLCSVSDDEHIVVVAYDNGNGLAVIALRDNKLRQILGGTGVVVDLIRAAVILEVEVRYVNRIKLFVNYSVFNREVHSADIAVLDVAEVIFAVFIDIRGFRRNYRNKFRMDGHIVVEHIEGVVFVYIRSLAPCIIGVQVIQRAAFIGCYGDCHRIVELRRIGTRNAAAAVGFVADIQVGFAEGDRHHDVGVGHREMLKVRRDRCAVVTGDGDLVKLKACGGHDFELYIVAEIRGVRARYPAAFGFRVADVIGLLCEFGGNGNAAPRHDEFVAGHLDGMIVSVTDIQRFELIVCFGLDRQGDCFTIECPVFIGSYRSVGGGFDRDIRLRFFDRFRIGIRFAAELRLSGIGRLTDLVVRGDLSVHGLLMLTAIISASKHRVSRFAVILPVP